MAANAWGTVGRETFANTMTSILRITKYMTNAHNSCQFMAAHAWGTVGGETLANNKMNIAIFRITKYMTNVLNSCQCKT